MGAHKVVYLPSFLDSVDALRHALLSEGRFNGNSKRGTGPAKISCDSMVAQNGLKYFCVQVTHADISYRIHAYGDEADRLYGEVQKHMQLEKKENSGSNGQRAD
jgi:hypothetical protein